MGGKLLAYPEPPLSKVATSAAHGEDSPYFAGWRAYDEDPYDPITNHSGVIQMGLAENQVYLLILFLLPVHCKMQDHMHQETEHGRLILGVGVV